MRLAAVAASIRFARSHLEPLRVLPERRLPADSSLPGHTPAQEARCLAVGNALMSPPVSAMITSAVRRWMPGIVQSASTAGCERGDLRLDRGRDLGDRFVEIVDVREDPADDDRVLGIEAALQCLA